MARTFTITCAAGTIRLAGQARGECTFTVTNTSVAAVQAHPTVVALDGRAGAWFAVAGEPLRELAPGQTVQVTVVINPSGAPPGRYGFRLDVLPGAGGERTAGPEACVELTSEAAPLAVGSKPFPWWWLVIAAAVLLIVGAVLWLVLGRSDPTTSEKADPVQGQPAADQPAGGQPTTPDAGTTTAEPTRPGTDDRSPTGEAEELAERWVSAFRKQDPKSLAALTSAPALIDGQRAEDDGAIVGLYQQVLSQRRAAKPATLARQKPVVARVHQVEAKLPPAAKRIGLDRNDHAIGVTIADSDLTFVLLIRHGPPARIAGVAR